MPSRLSSTAPPLAGSRRSRPGSPLPAATGRRRSHRSACRPHLSLAVYDDLPIDGVATALDALAVGTGNTDLLISSIGAFPAAGAASVAFLAPAVTDPLLALHHYCHRALAPLGHACWEQYQPGHWVPHVTVAMGLDREALSTAMACCASGWAPFRARLVALRLIGFPPVMALKQWPLRATAG
jgi:2'-5' RNA ligase